MPDMDLLDDNDMALLVHRIPDTSAATNFVLKEAPPA